MSVAGGHPHLHLQTCGFHFSDPGHADDEASSTRESSLGMDVSVPGTLLDRGSHLTWDILRWEIKVLSPGQSAHLTQDFFEGEIKGTDPVLPPDQSVHLTRDFFEGRCKGTDPVLSPDQSVHLTRDFFEGRIRGRTLCCPLTKVST